MSKIQHFVPKTPGNDLEEYKRAYPNQLVVQTRTKSDLMITARQPGSKQSTPVFIPKSLPTDVTRQSPAKTVMQSDDFLSLLSRKIIVLVVPDEGLSKFLKASDDRLRAIQGKDRLDLTSLNELTNASPEEQDKHQIAAVVINNVNRLNRIYAGDLEYGTIEAGEAILLEADLSINDAERAYIRANFEHAEVLAKLWDE